MSIIRWLYGPCSWRERGRKRRRDTPPARGACPHCRMAAAAVLRRMTRYARPVAQP